MEHVQLQKINHNNTIEDKANSDSEFGKRHEWKRLSLILVTYVLFILALAFNFLQSLFWTPTSDLFPSTTGDISDKFFTDITPAGWTFTIWGFIYTWQAVWLVYSFTCIFRRTRSGYLLYLNPDFFHYSIFIFVLLNLIFNIIWIFVWGYSYIGWALLFIVLIMVTLYIALFISHRKLKENEQKLRDEGLAKDVWFTIFFVQNGLAFYATWVSIASNLNFAIYIIWGLGANIENAGTAALFLILAAILLYFILENFIWRHYLIYTFSPWIVLVIALIGSLSKNWIAASPTRNNIITLLLLVIVILLIIARVIIFILYKTVCKRRFISFRVSNTNEQAIHKV